MKENRRLDHKSQSWHCHVYVQYNQFLEESHVALLGEYFLFPLQSQKGFFIVTWNDTTLGGRFESL